jgi:RimJ/RimL family protein N-acetyltransferase
MSEILEIQTRRLTLRQWRQSDRDSFAALNADPQVMEFFPATLDRTQSDALAEKIQSLIAQSGWGLWAVEQKAGDPFIGFVGLHIPDPALPFGPCVEIGWRLAARCWGNGYASEAAVEVLRTAFETLELKEVVAFTSILNQRSQAVMRRIGMIHSGELFEHPAVAVGHPLRTHVLYRIRNLIHSAHRLHK